MYSPLYLFFHENGNHTEYINIYIFIGSSQNVFETAVNSSIVEFSFKQI